MAYSQIVNVAISLDIAAVSRAGFGILTIASDHVRFQERTQAYTDIDGVAAVFPTDSDAYIAATRAFSADIPPDQIKIGRREVATALFTADSAINLTGALYQVQIIDSLGASQLVTYNTVGDDESLATIAAGLVAAAPAISGLAYAVSTDDFEITVTPGTSWNVGITGPTTTTSNLVQATTTTETAADMLSAIIAEDDDWYFLMCDDHSSSFVEALAAAVESRIKLYFVSLQTVDNLTSYDEDTSTDTMAVLKNNAYFRTSAWYHHLADTTFPEAGYVTIASPSDPGKKIWANNRVVGTPAARNLTTNLTLSTSEKANLNDRNANYTEIVGGITITRRGTVSGGATFLISLVRNRDFLVARITENVQNFLINTPVVPYTNAGINKVRNVVTSTLNRYVETETQPHILQQEDPYVTNFPNRRDISFSDVANGTFTGSFTAYLSGAIGEIAITGSLTYQAAS